MTNEELLHVGSRLKVSPDKIRLLKADINYTLIYLEDGSQLLSSTTLGILERRLNGYPFFRPNRSVIINLAFIAKFQKETFQIKTQDNELISISRRRLKKTVRSKFE